MFVYCRQNIPEGNYNKMEQKVLPLSVKQKKKHILNVIKTIFSAFTLIVYPLDALFCLLFRLPLGTATERASVNSTIFL